jgi:hypothetical protein
MQCTALNRYGGQAPKAPAIGIRNPEIIQPSLPGASVKLKELSAIPFGSVCTVPLNHPSATTETAASEPTTDSHALQCFGYGLGRLKHDVCSRRMPGWIPFVAFGQLRTLARQTTQARPVDLHRVEIVFAVRAGFIEGEEIVRAPIQVPGLIRDHGYSLNETGGRLSARFRRGHQNTCSQGSYGRRERCCKPNPHSSNDDKREAMTGTSCERIHKVETAF